MISRLRLVAAFLTLLTLSLTVAEGAWASMCMPTMEMDTEMATMAPSAHGMEMSSPVGVEHAHDSDHAPNAPAAPNCPLAPAPGTCVALSVSLPAHAATTLPPFPECAGPAVSAAPSRDLLFASSFFRPPRP